MSQTDVLDWTEVLDPEVIQSLRELGGEDDPELLCELVELFTSDSPARVSEMRRGVESSDWSVVDAMAHALKSSSANVGAMKLSELCRQTEVASKQADRDATDAAVTALEGEFQRVLKALELVTAN